MYDLAKFQRVESEDDPRRCQKVCGTHQCFFIRLPNTDFCKIHTVGPTRIEEKEKIFNYNVLKYRARLIQFAENPQVKSLREEVGVLRLLLEETLNKCDNSNQLLLYSTKLRELVLSIDKVVNSCHNLETKTGQLLDKSVILKLTDNLLEIISSYIKDPELLNGLSEDFLRLLSEQYTDPVSIN